MKRIKRSIGKIIRHNIVNIVGAFKYHGATCFPEARVTEIKRGTIVVSFLVTDNLFGPSEIRTANISVHSGFAIGHSVWLVKEDIYEAKPKEFYDTLPFGEEIYERQKNVYNPEPVEGIVKYVLSDKITALGSFDKSIERRKIAQKQAQEIGSILKATDEDRLQESEKEINKLLGIKDESALQPS